MSTDPWVEWFQLVMTGVGAAKDAVNSDTMWAWSGAESGADRMRWNNPLNTEYILNGVPMNPNGVQGYPSPSDGAIATVATLFSGYYPIIISNLVSSLPRAQWGNACGELGIWGTGCSWLNTDYGSAPGQAVEDIEMKALIINTPNNQGQWLLWGSLYVQIASPADVEALQANGAGGPMDVSEGFHTNLLAATKSGGTTPFPRGFTGTFS